MGTMFASSAMVRLDLGRRKLSLALFYFVILIGHVDTPCPLQTV